LFGIRGVGATGASITLPAIPVAVVRGADTCIVGKGARVARAVGVPRVEGPVFGTGKSPK